MMPGKHVARTIPQHLKLWMQKKRVVDKWTQEDIAKAMTAKGYPMTRDTARRILLSLESPEPKTSLKECSSALSILTDVLRVLQSGLEELLGAEGKLSSQDLNKALRLSSEIRSTVLAIEQIKASMPPIEESPEALFERFLKVLEGAGIDLPTLERIEQEWRKYEHSTK